MTDSEQYGPVAARLAAFAADLDVRGSARAAHLRPRATQHPARYGDGPALDSGRAGVRCRHRAAIAQITPAEASGIPAQALAAASMAHLAAVLRPDPHFRVPRRCWVSDTSSIGPLDRTLRDHTLALADPRPGVLPAVGICLGGDSVAAAWSARDTALARLPPGPPDQQRDPGTVLRTLLHEHHVRAVGVDPDLREGDRPPRPRRGATSASPWPVPDDTGPSATPHRTSGVTLTLDEVAGQSGTGRQSRAAAHRAGPGPDPAVGPSPTPTSGRSRPARSTPPTHAGLYYGAPAIAFVLHAAAGRAPRLPRGGRRPSTGTCCA